MKSYTRFALAALMVAFTLSGCDSGGITPPIIPDPDLKPYSMTDPVIESPASGVSVTQGDMLSCRVRVSEKNPPAGSLLKETWYVNGVEVVCDSIPNTAGPQLASGVPLAPVTSSLPPGEYTVVAKTCNTSNGVCKESASVTITVVERVVYDQILVRVVEAVYPNQGCTDIWTADAVPGATLRRLTIGCNKGTFDVTRDGKTLWYGENDGASNRVWKSNLDGSSPVAIPVVWNGQPVTNITNLEVSPDGSKVSFLAIALDGYSYTFVMNADGTGLRSLVNLVTDIELGARSPGIGSAWMPDSQHLMVVQDSAGLIGNTFQIVQNRYIMLDLETGTEETVYVAKYGEDQHSSILRQISGVGDWFLIWEIRNTGRATIIRTDGSGEVRPLTERLKNASLPIFCGEAVCAASNPTTVFRVGLDGQTRGDLFTVNGWVVDLAFLPSGS